MYIYEGPILQEATGILLILLALYAGYILGKKNLLKEEKKETTTDKPEIVNCLNVETNETVTWYFINSSKKREGKLVINALDQIEGIQEETGAFYPITLLTDEQQETLIKGYNRMKRFESHSYLKNLANPEIAQRVKLANPKTFEEVVAEIKAGGADNE